jgi:HPt (histidine-containing phosphotransfer) domain-containing protein
MASAYRNPLDERVKLLQHGVAGASMTPTDLLDLTTLQNLVDLDDGSHGLVSEMIAIFRDDTPRRLEDILTAAEKGDAEGLSRAAHALKGGAGALGARALRLLAADLEVLGRNGSVDAGPDLAGRLEGLFQRSLAALETYVAEHPAP